MTSEHRTFRRAALLAGGALLGFNMLMSALSRAPLSPAKLRYSGAVDSYLDPYFTQNWGLFAPEPIMDDRGALARARCADGDVTGFYDITAPFLAQARGSRFFPSRKVRVVTGAVQQLGGTDELLARLRKKADGKGRDVPLQPHEKETQAQALALLSRFALDHLPDACDGRPARVQIRMYVRELTPWSRRHAPDTEERVTAHDFPWQDTKELR